jgi:hypothetical protein
MSTETERLRATLVRIDNLLSWPADEETLPAIRALVTAALNPPPVDDNRPPLTVAQDRMLDFIRSFRDSHGIPPTTREIGTALGITSPNGVRGHLMALQKKGYLKSTPLKSRTLAVVEANQC